MTYLTLQIHLPEAIEQTPIVAEIIDDEFVIVWQDTVITGSKTNTDNLDAGKYLIRAHLSIGTILTHQLQITTQTPDQLPVNIYPEEGMLKLMSRPQTYLRGGQHDAEMVTSFSLPPKGYIEAQDNLLNALEEHTWVRLWTRKSMAENWRPAPWRGETSRPFDNLIQYEFPDLALEQRYVLQIGGEAVRWQLVTLPPSGAIVTIAALPDPIQTDHPLKITVSHTDTMAEALMTYMDRGAMDKAEHISREMAEALLRNKYLDPIKATVASYYLLRTNQLDRRAHWARNLARDMTWLPDGAIIYAWHLLKQENPNLAEVQSWLVQAVERGVPIHTEGLRLLYDALSLFSNTDAPNPGEIAEALAAIKRFASVADWQATTVSFPGTSPNRPGFASADGQTSLKGIPEDLTQVVYLDGTPVNPLMLGQGIPIRNPEVSALLSEAIKAAERWERIPSTSGRYRIGEAEKAFTALSNSEIRLENGEATIRRLSAPDFKAQGATLHPDNAQTMQDDQADVYYLLAIPVRLHPARGAQYRRLESFFEFSPFGDEGTVSIKSIFPVAPWQTVLNWGKKITLALDGNFTWGAEVDQSANKITRLDSSLKGRVQKPTQLTRFIKLDSFNNSLGRLSIETHHQPNTAVWQINSKRNFKMDDVTQFIFLLKASKAVRSIKIESIVQADVHFSWLYEKTKAIFERLPESMQQILTQETGLPMQDFRTWTLNLPT